MKRIFIGGMLVGAVLLLSGCSFPGISKKGTGASIQKSTDGGKTYQPKVTIDAKTTIAPAEVLSFVFETGNSKNITIGTRENGIFTTSNGGDTWRKMDFPPVKTYGLVSDRVRPERLYATGEWQGRGKVYRTNDRGGKWEEVYAEPNTGTVITALAQSPKDPLTLFVGTSAGVILRTTDGGMTWGNADMVSAPILSFLFDTAGETMYALVSGKGIARSQNGGERFQLLSKISKNSGKSSAPQSLPKVTALAVDPSRNGVLYAGTEAGLFRSVDSGDSWEAVSVLENAKKFPIRAIAVNPKNSNELVYSAALAFYKTVDGGTRWSIYELEANRAAGTLRYDPSDPTILYAGLRTFNE
ncbi:MAG: hypothetical protein IPL87_02130 [Candidatus Moraniibacteriota bacterium]|nr:MAG: hypothetical protein IPL87_02130 [Candidatus Moranbacteria bacterium]